MNNKEKTKEYIKVMQAYVDGAAIEFKLDGGWHSTNTPIWDWQSKTKITRTV